MKLKPNLVGRIVAIEFKDPTGAVTLDKWSHAKVTAYTSEYDDEDGESYDIRLDNDPSLYLVYGHEIKSIRVIK
ncbi:hypothetical protein F9B82_09485 [Lacticaseibacillus casei]|uniref:Uncharacterized protein n=1 Tax=Lacticaseibacillus casei TaxID=1582 RepID=A0AAN1C7N1_LACCA|nr:hypothetical protein BGL52_04915 [Lacticaseibacillus casei]KAB1969135.1 hypothetical protein F9B82_09485 [Lacticaseibacillus casei]